MISRLHNTVNTVTPLRSALQARTGTPARTGTQIRPSRSAIFTTTAVACTLMVATACGDDPAITAGSTTTTPKTSTTTDGSTTTTPAAPSDPKDTSAKPTIDTPAGDPPAKLTTEDTVVGTGAEATANSFIEVDYVGASWSTGEEFDASWDRGQLFDLTLGTGSVIPGWEQGLVGMRVGGRRKIIIPPDLGYGAQGTGDKIGPNETLIFVVDLRFAGTAPSVDPAALLPAQELSTTDVTVGSGATLGSTGTAKIMYSAFAVSTKKEITSTWTGTSPTPYVAQMGGSTLIPGLEKGIVGMKVGGRRQIVIPPDLAYGAAGAGNGAIGPNETLVYVVDLVEIPAA